VRQDSNIVAVILLGSLSYDEVWEKSDIDLFLIRREDRKSPESLCLVEDGINIHASIFPRSKFREFLEKSLQSSFFHSAFSRSTLVYSTDDTLVEYYEDARRVGSRDREMQLLREGCNVMPALAKAEKWCYVKRDYAYSFVYLMHVVAGLAHIEETLHSEVATREVIQQALQHNPEFFKAVYLDMVHGPKDEITLPAALQLVDSYLTDRIPSLFSPILTYLKESGGARSTTEIDAFFHKRAQTESLASAYEWLADKGVIRKVSAPVALTDKSRVRVDEAAYYYDGGEE